MSFDTHFFLLLTYYISRKCIPPIVIPYKLVEKLGERKFFFSGFCLPSKLSSSSIPGVDASRWSFLLVHWCKLAIILGISSYGTSLQILFATCEGRILNDLTLKGFDRPCAVSVLRPGRKFHVLLLLRCYIIYLTNLFSFVEALGILDRSNLYLYEHHMRRLSILATGLHARHRGRYT